MKWILSACIALLVSHQAFAQKCLLGTIDSSGNPAATGDLGEIDPKDENSVGSAAIDSKLSAACLGMGASEPGILCGILEANLSRSEMLDALISHREGLKTKGTIYVSAYATDMSEVGIRWLNVADGKEYLVGCLP